MKERGSLLVVPSSLTESLDVAGYAGLAAIAREELAGSKDKHE